jgi:hypothetical protein
MALELNLPVRNFENWGVQKSGALMFSHPNSINGDVFWAMVHRVYAIVEMKTLDLQAFKFG